MESKKTVLNLK